MWKLLCVLDRAQRNTTAAPTERAKHRKATLRRPRYEALEDRALLTTLPNGFTDTLVASGFSWPTAIEFSPLDELWVLNQDGRATLVRDDGTLHEALNLNVDYGGERGLLGIAFDPAYDGPGPNNDYVYLYYTEPRLSPTDPANNRISRFTVTGAGTATPTLTGEVLIRELPPEDEDNDPTTDGDKDSNGGALLFGNDGMLYVGVGDHNYDNTPQWSHVSQSLDTPFGKLLRLNPDGTNPSHNPYFTGSTTDWAGSIWALGLRNPSKMELHPGASTLYINDVGERMWEEINVWPPGLLAAPNFGWAGSTSTPLEGFLSEGFAVEGIYVDPLLAYDHTNSAPSPAGCAITGGAFNPSHGGQFGSEYAATYFFADFCENFIRVSKWYNPGSLGTPDTSTAFASDLEVSGPIDLAMDSAGSLYYVGWADIAFDFQVRKIAFGVPEITTQPSHQTVLAGDSTAFTVEVTGSAPMSFQWQKLIDSTWTDIAGATASSYVIPTTLSADSGQYRVIATNSAGTATSGEATLTVRVVDEVFGRTSTDGSLYVARTNGGSFAFEDWGGFYDGVTWDDILTGDFNGDGLDDVAGRTSGQWWVAISNGSGFTNSLWGRWSDLVWEDVLVADIDGDGTDDIVGRTSGQWWAARSTGTYFDVEYWGAWSDAVTWVDVQTGDFNGDGRGDIAGRTSGQWWVSLSQGTVFSVEYWGNWSDAVTWDDVTVGDYDGDGQSDIAGRTSGQWWVSLSEDTFFSVTYWGSWSNAVTWVDVLAADVNGDGRTDLVGRTSGQWWVARSTGTSTFSIEYWGSWSDAVAWSSVVIADLDGDSLDDIVGRTGSSWWASMSQGGNFSLQYWGSFGDSQNWANVSRGQFDSL